jgi:UDP-N-acetylmuramate--alanine ligase
MFESVKHVHFVGVGGIGMSAAAKWFLHSGRTVSGSDLHRSAIIDDLVRRGLVFHSGHAAQNIPMGTGLVVYTAAAQEDNLERAEATLRGIPQISYAEFLGELSRNYSTIVVCGTNGKSTTTAMLGLILEAAGYDPTVIVGSLVPGFAEGNLRMGKGRFFVVEGCEFKASFLKIEPEMAVITNIEEDHMDFFRDIDHIRETFQIFVDKLKGKGMVVLNADDPQSQELNVERAITFGMHQANYSPKNCPMHLSVPGDFNRMNALAATAAAMELGVPFETCARVLGSFKGIWRRFERVGQWHGAEIISDYGHHPTAITGTLQAARDFFPSRRIVLCFQPHQHSRTKELLEGFVESVQGADVIIVPEIYKVVGRTEKEEKEVSSRDIVDRVKQANTDKDIRYAADLKEAESILREVVREHDIVIIQGAGDIDDLARKLVV